MLYASCTSTALMRRFGIENRSFRQNLERRTSLVRAKTASVSKLANYFRAPNRYYSIPAAREKEAFSEILEFGRLTRGTRHGGFAANQRAASPWARQLWVPRYNIIRYSGNNVIKSTPYPLNYRWNIRIVFSRRYGSLSVYN